MENKNYRHGDISLHIISELPKTAKKIELKDEVYVLALGETSGHQHQLVGSGFEVFEDEKGLYVKVNHPTDIEHFDVNTRQKAEHNTITIQPAIYIKKHEQSFNPFDEEIHKTID